MKKTILFCGLLCGLLCVACGTPNRHTASADAPGSVSAASSGGTGCDSAFVERFDYLNSPISYEVSCDGRRLRIVPGGLSVANDTLRHDLKGYRVEHVAVGDLNIDGHPELYVFLQDGTPGRYGALIAYSPNRGRSLSEIYLPPIEGELADGYAGHDEMEIVESCLCRRFPLEGGRTRQIQYRLVPGEAGWLLHIDKILEY